jgi:hypothetical protein
VSVDTQPPSGTPDHAVVLQDSPTPQPTAAAAPTSECALCRTTGELKRSHIIPNSFFKAMKKDGKLVRFDFDEQSQVRLSIESWWEYLLCAECEARLGVLETK